MANTFIELNDTPSDFIGQGLKFLRVNADANAVVFGPVEINDLTDVQANLAYAPQSGQALIYSSAAGKWRPGTVDVYSAGNGISKSALTLNVIAGTGGGLTSNTNGVYITDIANVSGTWGNASYVPRLTINSKGQITGVTPTLITATQAVTITSPFVGNINGTSGQIRVTGGTGNNSNAIIDLVATGVTAATYGNTTHLPRITVDTYGRIQNVDLIAVAGNGQSIGNTLGFGNIIVAGQTTVSADQTSDDVTFVAGTGISITTQANADRITFSTNTSAIASAISLSDLNDVDASGIVNGQVLVWNSSTSMFEAGNMSGGGGDSNVDLSDFSVTTAAPSGNGSLVYNNAGVFTFTPANVQASGSTQSLSWNSSTYSLSISGGNSVDLSVLKDNTDAQTLSLSSNVITISGSNSSVNLTSILNSVAGNYGDSNVATYLSTNSYATQSYVTTQINTLTAGAATALDTLAEIANALNNSNSTLATVAFTGNHSSLTNRPTMSLVANTYLVYDTSNVNLSSVIGQPGPQGNIGNTGVSVTAATVTGANLIITLSNNTTIDAGNVKGAIGNSGVGITSVSLVSSNLVLNYSNTSTQDVGNIRGPQGNAGTNGVDISTATVNGSGNLIITLSNAATVDAGNVRGTNGTSGIQLSNISVTSNSPSGNGSLTYSNVTGVFTFTPAVGLTATGVTAGTYGNATTMPQFTVDSFGRITGVSNIAISAGGAGDIEGVTAGNGLIDGGASGTVTLNVGAGAGITVNADNIALTSGVVSTGAKTYGSATLIPQITVDTYGRVTSVSNVSVSGGGGGGGGAIIQRFKLNYSTTGTLANTSNLSDGISSVTIDSASGGECTINFTGYYYPPGSIMLYGYDRTNNKYLISHLETTMGQREIPGGGTAGSPTAFDGATSETVVKLKLREAETGASRAFGTTTHAWIQFVMYD
jgi:hypothetical protein